MKILKKYIVFGAPLITKNEIKEVNDCLNSGWIGTGPRVSRFENDFRKYKSAKYAAALNSCSAALFMSLLALKLQPDDEVITTALTFPSTVNAIIHAGAKPVLADVDFFTQNIDPEKIKEKISKKTKALIIVHFAGRPCEMKNIMNIVKKNNIFLIEDCAHAIESKYNGKHCGTFGDFGCFSFYSTKNLTTGEGGMVISSSKKKISEIKILALHGMSKNAWSRYSDKGFKHYDIIGAGYKYNMMDLQASLGIHQLKSISSNLIKRNLIWKIYNSEFKNLGIITPKEEDKNNIHSRHLYTILVNKKNNGVSRDQFLNLLHKNNIGAGVHYRSIPEFTYYKNKFKWKSNNYPNAKLIGDQTVSLPLSAKLNLEQVYKIVAVVKKILC